MVARGVLLKRPLVILASLALALLGAFGVAGLGPSAQAGVLSTLPTLTPTATPPAPTATPTICPYPTPEPLWVEPVTSPTDQLSQIITVRIGNGEEVVVIAESGTFTVTGSFSVANPAQVPIALLPNTTHHLEVRARVKVTTGFGGCTYGGYTLYTTTDKNYAPLTIVQQVTANTPPTATPTATVTPAGSSGPYALFFPLILNAGWNLVSVPVVPASPLGASGLALLAQQQGVNVDRVVRWQDGAWQTHIRGFSPNDFPVELGRGYFLRSPAGGTFQIQGTSFSPQMTLTPMPPATPTPGGALPDLVVVSFMDVQAMGASCADGPIIPLYHRVVVMNAGNAAAGPFDVYLSTPGVTAPETASQRVSGLAAGQTIILWFYYLPANTAIVDSASEVAESNEDNNHFMKGTVVATALPTCTPTVTPTGTPPTATSTPTSTPTPTGGGG